MSDVSVTDPAAVPIAFAAAGSWCFGWFHERRGPARGVGVVLCRPFGFEALCTYRAYTELADTLAEDGFDVVRFDYHGTGDSAGGDADAGRVPAWLDSIASAVAELKRRSGVSRIALFGVRLGATLAAQAASQLGGVESLVMWAPCTGRSFVRELRAASATDGDTGDIEALGYLYKAQTLRDLVALDRQDQAVAPASRVLIIARDDMPGEGPWAAKYRDSGIDTTCAAWPGYAGMMVEPHEAVIAGATLRSITDWLSASAAPATAPKPEWRQAAEAAANQVASVLDGVRETPLMFGAGRSLFGILTEPLAAQGDERAETAVLMLTIAGNHRIGPNRNYVMFARSLAATGYRALRFDLSGIGDSRTAAGFSGTGMYSMHRVAEVRAAMDCLAEKGCKRFYLMGLCSGCYAAFQTALADARVTGQILMNSRLLLGRGSTEGGTWEEAMQRAYKSTDFYWRSLLNPRVYWRIARGEVDVIGIATRLGSVAGARLKRAFDRVLGRVPTDEGLFAKFKHLSDRGTDTLMLFSAEDDGRDYVEFHLGTRGRRLGRDANFRMVVVQQADHTFSRSEGRQVVLATVREHLETRTSSMKEPSKVYLEGPKMLGAG
jgi:pimeloyl-ACP methyl ester carboxylesterase